MPKYKEFNIEEKLLKELIEFCEFNGLSSEEDKCKEISRILRVGFNVTKFGDSPFKETKKVENEAPKKKIGRPRKNIEVVQEVKQQTETTEEPRKKVKIIKN